MVIVPFGERLLQQQPALWHHIPHTTYPIRHAGCCLSFTRGLSRLSTLDSRPNPPRSCSNPAQTQNPRASSAHLAASHLPVAIAVLWTMVVRHLRPRTVVETTKEQLEGQAVVSCRCTVQLAGLGLAHGSRTQCTSRASDKSSRGRSSSEGSSGSGECVWSHHVERGISRHLDHSGDIQAMPCLVGAFDVWLSECKVPSSRLSRC